MKQTSLPPRRRGAIRRIAGYAAQQDHVPDPYDQQEKLHEGSLCPQCGAVYDGRRHPKTR